MSESQILLFFFKLSVIEGRGNNDNFKTSAHILSILSSRKKIHSNQEQVKQLKTQRDVDKTVLQPCFLQTHIF